MFSTSRETIPRGRRLESDRRPKMYYRAAILGWDIYTIDVSQAYTQGEPVLQNMEKTNQVLKVITFSAVASV